MSSQGPSQQPDIPSQGESNQPPPTSTKESNKPVKAASATFGPRPVNDSSEGTQTKGTAALLNVHQAKIHIGNLYNNDKSDELLELLQEWDTDGDGCFTTGEILIAAKQMLKLRESHKKHKRSSAFYKKLSLCSFLFIIVLLAAISVMTYLVVQMSQETGIQSPDGSAVLTSKRGEAEGGVVGTSIVLHDSPGLESLFDATVEDLDGLTTVYFAHAGQYIQIRVSQFVRGSDTCKVYGDPGMVLVHRNGTILWKEIRDHGNGTSEIVADGVEPADFDPMMPGTSGRRLYPSLAESGSGRRLHESDADYEDDAPLNLKGLPSRRLGKGGGGYVASRGSYGGGDGKGDDMEWWRWVIAIVPVLFVLGIICAVMKKEMTKMNEKEEDEEG